MPNPNAQRASRSSRSTSVEKAIDLGDVDVTLQGGAINVYDRQNLFYFDLFTFRRVDQLSFLPYLSLLVEIR